MSQQQKVEHPRGFIMPASPKEAAQVILGRFGVEFGTKLGQQLTWLPMTDEPPDPARQFMMPQHPGRAVQLIYTLFGADFTVLLFRYAWDGLSVFDHRDFLANLEPEQRDEIRQWLEEHIEETPSGPTPCA